MGIMVRVAGRGRSHRGDGYQECTGDRSSWRGAPGMLGLDIKARRAGRRRSHQSHGHH
jgi:hypothetical protein